jgi:hypothetical protein
MKELAKRLVKCKGWRWMFGMGVANPDGVPHRIVVVEPPPLGTLVCVKGRGIVGLRPDDVPDLTDPATLGCLLALVREARGQPNAYARLRREPRSHQELHWEVLANAEEWRESVLGAGATEAEALVAALEAA